MVRDLSN